MCKKKFRISFPCYNKLLLAFKDLLNDTKQCPNDLLLSMIIKSKRPENFQRNYTPEYDGEKSETFDQRVTEDCFMKFNTFSVAFKSKADSLDYLIVKEKEQGVFPSDYISEF